MRHDPIPLASATRAFAAALTLLFAGSAAFAQDKPAAPLASQEKPPLAPDTVGPLSVASRISATVEFGLPALAADIERDIPRRLATIDERVSCVHRRVFIFHINANCDIWGHVDRTGGVSLSGRNGRLYGAVPIYGVVEGQGANRFTAAIHGDTEARAIVEVESRPQLTRDWSLALNLTDGFHWSEPPVLHVLGRSIPIARYAEPRIRMALASVSARAAAAARRLDLHDKAERAWRQTFEPLQLSETPEIWAQFAPQSAAFAGIGANANALWGSLEFSGAAQTSFGARPAEAAPTPLPPLARDVAAPGSFDIVLPIVIAYDAIKDRITEALKSDPAVREVQVYPSSGKLVVGLRTAAAGADANAGQWTYLSAALDVDAVKSVASLANVAAAGSDLDPSLAPLRDQIRLDYAKDYQRLLDAADKKLNRPLKDGFRVAGHVSAVKLEKVYLASQGIVVALRASGELKILYGL